MLFQCNLLVILTIYNSDFSPIMKLFVQNATTGETRLILCSSTNLNVNHIKERVAEKIAGDIERIEISVDECFVTMDEDALECVKDSQSCKIKVFLQRFLDFSPLLYFKRL